MLLKIVGAIMPLRTSADEESMGLDLGQHGEEAYIQTGGADSHAF